jgi:L-aspartate oxidase
MEQITTDVLVIGAGAAGARAALEAARTGARTLLVTKGTVGTAGASAYGGSDTAGFGASGFVDPEDSPAIHLQDILEAGQGMADPALAAIVAAEAPRQLLALERLGVPFVRAGESYLATRSCFSSRPRSIKVKGHGRPIVECLRRHLLALPNVQVLEQTTATDPILDDSGRCVGALAWRGPAGPIPLLAGATILATGGAGRLFEGSLNPPDVTGDGYAFGLRAGAELVNLEFMQAGFGILAPRGSGIFQYWLWDLRPALHSRTGEPFLHRYLAPTPALEDLMAAKARHFPFSVNDISRCLEIAVQSFINDERDAGREGAVYMSISGVEERVRALPEDHNLRRMWVLSREFLIALGIDLESPFRIAPAAHAMNGGLVIDQFARTQVEGLYAVGEVAGGPHGADRLGGNMFPTGQVFGERAGLHAADAARRHPAPPKTPCRTSAWPRPISPGPEPAPEDLPALRGQLQRLASRALLIVREAAPLDRFLAAIQELESRLPAPTSPAGAELAGLLLTGRAMATAALLREESRGGHYRVDFPETREAWTRRIRLRLAPDGQILTRLG